MALLYNTFDRTTSDATAARTIRDLSVLLAEIESGALLQPEDPNYALLSGAARTIKDLLDRLITNKFAPHALMQPIAAALAEGPFSFVGTGLSTWDTQGLQDYDPAFWLNLSEHPFLMASETGLPTFP